MGHYWISGRSAAWHAPPAHQRWFGTKRECQVALNEAITALRSGTLVQPARRMMASFPVEEWLSGGAG